MRPDAADWDTPDAGPEATPRSTASGRSRHAGASGAERRGRRGGRRDGKDREPAADADLGPDADVESFARQILLRRLTDQPRSRADLAETLAKRNVPDDVGKALLDRFEQVGLIDDEEFARSWVRSRQRSRGLAGRVLAQELRRKGIDDEIVKEAVDEIEPEDEERSARELVRKKLRSMRGLEEQKKIRRLTGMLARKGYPAGLAFSVVREELGAETEGAGAEGLEGF
ncbi:MAG: regulatory protein RecX [Nocardioidaceae bacterium]